MVSQGVQSLNNHTKEPFINILNTLTLKCDRHIKVNFDGGDLFFDAGLLLIKEFAVVAGAPAAP